MSDLPPPPVPPECDLRGFTFMPLDVGRLLDSELFLTANGEEFKSALALWCKSWTQVPAASLPDNDKMLAVYSGANGKWKRVRKVALHGWVKASDGRLYHPVVAEKAKEAWAKKEMQRHKANKRWGNATAHATASPTAHATAMQGTGIEGNRIERHSPTPLAAAAAADLPEGIGSPPLEEPIREPNGKQVVAPGLSDWLITHPRAWVKDCRDDWDALIRRAWAEGRQEGLDILDEVYREQCKGKPKGPIFLEQITSNIRFT